MSARDLTTDSLFEKQANDLTHPRGKAARIIGQAVRRWLARRELKHRKVTVQQKAARHDAAKAGAPVDPRLLRSQLFSALAPADEKRKPRATAFVNSIAI